MNHLCYWSEKLSPNIYIYCEEQLCGMIREPANTWSNVGYLVVAILIFRSKQVTNKRVQNLFSLSALCLFLGSSFFHATSSYAGRLTDVATMFFLSSTILGLAVERSFKISKFKANLFFIAMLGLSFSVLQTDHISSALFFIQLFMGAYLESRLSKSSQGLDQKKILQALGLLVLAFIFWVLDVKKILCIPDNHILTGHGVWHLLTAMAIWVYFKSYFTKTTLTGTA